MESTVDGGRWKQYLESGAFSKPLVSACRRMGDACGITAIRGDWCEHVFVFGCLGASLSAVRVLVRKMIENCGGKAFERVASIHIEGRFATGSQVGRTDPWIEQRRKHERAALLVSSRDAAHGEDGGLMLNRSGEVEGLGESAIERTRRRRPPAFDSVNRKNADEFATLAETWRGENIRRFRTSAARSTTLLE